MSDHAPSKKQKHHKQILNKQGDGPNLDKNPRGPVNTNNYPSRLIIGSYQVFIAPQKRLLT